MDLWSEFHGPNAGYVLELYERYLRDPRSIDARLRAQFERWRPAEPGVDGMAGGLPLDAARAAYAPAAIAGAVELAHAIRGYGHLAARLDPLGAPAPGDPSLAPETHGLSEAQLRELPAAVIGGRAAAQAANALEAINALREVYSGTIGYDYDHIRVPEERAWLREMAESRCFRPPQDPIDETGLLERLTQVEAFEKFLHRAFPGRTRFSIEGLDLLVPMLDEIIGDAAESGTRSVLLGMAHRGRLNVLAHVLSKPYAQILAEFKDPLRSHSRPDQEDLGWTGDVKYHLGARRALRGGQAVEVVVTLPPNPSHLEAVNPVVEGMARAAGTQVDGPGLPRFDPAVTIPVLIHGDAAFPAQGVVAETLNLAQVEGYATGGTVHLIANNQLGYTATPREGRSTLYAGDLAKGFKIPIVHVNADDPEACLEAARLAIAYRSRFHKDFLVDLIGYRRYGHNEGDEPGFTQPRMYAAIESHPSVRALWAHTLEQRGRLEPGQGDRLLEARLRELQAALDNLRPEDLVEPQPEPPPPGAARRVKTSVPLDQLQAIHTALLSPPEGFQPHPKLRRAMERRRNALADPDQPRVDWSTAEQLALGTILADGTAIRFTGQDTERGTFSQRHAVLHDHATGRQYVPLQHLPGARAAFEIHNSPLSENAAVGYEFGYNVQAPSRLVLWEAQYGDFINGAQVVIDEFLMPGRAKWGQTPSLVLLLPHGYEGQGPDHSSGRMERFLNLAAELNVRVANCTTAAQYFHLLRRQALLLETDPLPLVVLTPKSLLRHAGAASPPRDLVERGWQPVIDDAAADPAAVRRLLLCSGKLYFDLAARRDREPAPHVALARVEQLYPFPEEDLRQALERYPALEAVTWAQEEPENMGAWQSLQPDLLRLIAGRWPLLCVARPRNASPAEGSAARHAEVQRSIVEAAWQPTSSSPS
jgi:2-oxoglutarate dehydrogenase E1 component